MKNSFWTPLRNTNNQSNHDYGLFVKYFLNNLESVCNSMHKYKSMVEEKMDNSAGLVFTSLGEPGP
jgi:hypothetical protein